MSTDGFQLAGSRTVDAEGRSKGFVPTSLPRPHPLRRRAILAAHPEIASLIGHDPWTAAITLGVVAGQTAIAAAFGFFGPSYWWAALLAAICIGAFANHA